MSLYDRSALDPPQLAADSSQADTSSDAPSSDSRSASFDTPEARRVDEIAELASRIAASGDAETSVPSAPRGDTGDARNGSPSSDRATGENAPANDQQRPTRRRGGWLAAVAGVLVRSPLGALCRTLGRSVRRTVARDGALSVALSRSVGGALSLSHAVTWFAVRVVAVKLLRKPVRAIGPPLLWPALHVVAIMHLEARLSGGKGGGRAGGGGTVGGELVAGRGAGGEEEAETLLREIGGPLEMVGRVVTVTRGGTWMIMETFAAPLLVSTLSALLPFLLPARPSSRAPPKDPPHMLPPPVEPRPSLSAARAAARASARAAAAAAVAASPEGAGSVAGASSVSDYSLDGSPAASDTASSASPPSSRPSTPPPRAAVLPALPSPPSPVLSPADQVLIQDVRSALEDADVDTQDWLTDDTVLRYAVPGKRHVATMVNRIRATATWRRSFRLLAPAEVLCSPWRPFGYWHGADVDGRPCLVLHLGRAARAIPSASHADFVCYLASLVSAVAAALTLACPDSGRIAVILDCQGAPALWHLPVGLLRATITALHRNFPHRMARLHVLHLPPALRLLARAMLQLLSPGTRSKIQIIGGGTSATSSLSDLFGLQLSVPARLAGAVTTHACVAPASLPYTSPDSPSQLPPYLCSTLGQRAGGVAGGGVGREAVGEPERASSAESPVGNDAANPSHSSIAAAAVAAELGESVGTGLGLGLEAAAGVVPDQFVSTDDLPAANGAANAATGAARPEGFNPKLAGIEEEERMVNELLTWLEERGVKGIRDDDAAIKVFIDANTTLKASGRSRANLRMVARRPIAEGEAFLSLPRSLALTESHAQEEAKPYEGEVRPFTALAAVPLPSTALPFPSPHSAQVHPFTALAAWVLRERGKGRASLWAPLVRLLPAHLPFPHLFSDRLRTELQSQSLLLATAEHKRMLSEEYKKCRPEAIANAREEEFLWAVGMANGTHITFTETASISPGQHVSVESGLLANDTHITFTATANIAAGQHVSVESGLLANDEALLTRGMALQTNYRDSADVFEFPEPAIDFFGRHYFRTHWESFMETDVEQVFADMEKALKVEVTKDRYKGIPDEPEFRIDTQASLRVWFGGRLDPRLLGGLAALHAHVMNKEAPDYAALARPAVDYSWLKEPKTTCDDYAASLPDNLGDSIPAAGTGILERARQMLQAMGTSREGDLQRMYVVQACKVQVLYGTYPGDKPLMCPPDFVRELPDWEAALAYRLSKKEVLSHVIARLTATCDA
ncbi:unnamed protein product [Closterium sp. NIES-65]|nr:unnamed protein product [Closterium sp. NIES-65]